MKVQHFNWLYYLAGSEYALKKGYVQKPQTQPLQSPFARLRRAGQGRQWYTAHHVGKELGLCPAFTIFHAIMMLGAQTSIGALPADDCTPSAGFIVRLLES